MEKEKIRPLYSELKGYLSQAPTIKEPYEYTNDESIWEQYNKSVDLVSKITGEDLRRFLIVPTEGGYGSKLLHIITYRQKLGGLISYLHGKYFADEPAPLGEAPKTVITQSQQQTQYIQMLLEMQSKIDEKLQGCEEGSKEKNFLQRIKSSLSSITSATQLISQILNIAKEFGLNVDDILRLFR
jgi:hypothetical protein